MEKIIISSIGRSILNSISSGIIILNNSGKIIFANRSAYKEYHIPSSKEVISRHYKEVLSEEISQEIEKAIEEVKIGSLYRIDQIKFYDNGMEVFFGATVYPLFNEWSELIGFIVNGKDITKIILESEEKKKLKELNEKLNLIIENFKKQNEELNSAVNRSENIIKTVFSTLSSPITKLLSLIDDLDNIKSLDELEDIKKGFKDFVTTFMYLKEEFAQYTSFSVGSNKKTEYINIANILDIVIKDLESEIKNKGIELKINLQYSDKKCLLTSKEDTILVFKNILSNAIHYSKENGIVEIEDRFWEGYYFIVIKDYGIGIRQEELKNIFTPFYRGEESIKMAKGIGLGLTIAKMIIEEMGGAIEVESEYGKGTTVTFYFKAYDCNK